MQETWDVGSSPGSRRSSGGGSDNSLQYFCLENAMDRGAWLQSKGLQRVGNDWVTNSALVHTRACEPSHFSCVWLFVTLWTIACQAPLSMRSLGKSTRVGCHALLQRIFPTQVSNLSLLHCKRILTHWAIWVAPAVAQSCSQRYCLIYSNLFSSVLVIWLDVKWKRWFEGSQMIVLNRWLRI